MHILDMKDLFLALEDNDHAEWRDAHGSPLSRASKGLPLEALGNLDGSKAYFYRLEPQGGYTIYEFDRATAGAKAVSGWGQFLDETYADEATKAFAKGRVTADLVKAAFQVRKSRTLDGVMIYKRNQARSGNIKEWREAERKRIVPKDSEKIVPFIVDMAQKWPIDVIKAIRDVFSVMLENGAAKD